MSLSVRAFGTSPVSYQWSQNFQPIPGATSPVLTFSPLISASAGHYQVKVTNPAGSAYSQVVTVGVNPPIQPNVVTEPKDVTLTQGSGFTVSVLAIGTAPLRYQWFKNGVGIPSATNSSYSISSAVVADSGSYQVAVIGPGGADHSTAATVTVNPPVFPQIILAPASRTLNVGDRLTLSVTATGTGPLTYEWIHIANGVVTTNSTSASFSVAHTTMADAGFYRVLVSGPGGAVWSDTIKIGITPAVPTSTFWMYPGLTVSGTVGATYSIQFSTNTPPVWQNITNVTITTANPTILWLDLASPTAPGEPPARQYRAIASPF